MPEGGPEGLPGDDIDGCEHQRQRQIRLYAPYPSKTYLCYVLIFRSLKKSNALTAEGQSMRSLRSHQIAP